MNQIVPFFVADRPMSLRLLKSLPLQDYVGVSIGIMAHANTTLNFQHAYRQYPCENFEYCDAVGGPCQHKDDIFQCPVREYILGHTVKMCDSGIFTREGATLSYQQLFEAYVRMGVEYGIMIDVFLDPQATLESAKEALRVYEPFKECFKLVGVAQGTTIEEYIQSYEDLKASGFSYIAIGGLLRKLEKTARYAQVRSEEFMFTVLETLRARYPDDWLFVLGSFHPSRLENLQELNTWGDYKGWIFQYKKRNEALNAHLEVFASNHLQHVENVDSQKMSQLVARLQEKVSQRKDTIVEQKKLSKQLVESRRTLKAALTSLYEITKIKAPEVAARLRRLTTRGLLADSEEKLVLEILQGLATYESHEVQSVRENIHKNRELKAQIERIEARLNTMNISFAKDVAKLRAGEITLTEDTVEICAKIASLIESSERTFRFEQVRERIAQDILSRI